MTRLILNVRGSAGSGKSRMVHELFKFYASKERVTHPTLNTHIGYYLTKPNYQDLIVLGIYERGDQWTSSQGGDSFGFNLIKAFNLMRYFYNNSNASIFYESWACAIDFTYTNKNRDLPFEIFHLIVPLEERIQGRLDRLKFSAKKVAAKNSIEGFDLLDVKTETRISNVARRCKSEGIPVTKITRENAVEIITSKLITNQYNVPNQEETI